MCINGKQVNGLYEDPRGENYFASRLRLINEHFNKMLLAYFIKKLADVNCDFESLLDSILEAKDVVIQAELQEISQAYYIHYKTFLQDYRFSVVWQAQNSCVRFPLNKEAWIFFNDEEILDASKCRMNLFADITETEYEAIALANAAKSLLFCVVYRNPSLKNEMIERFTILSVKFEDRATLGDFYDRLREELAEVKNGILIKVLDCFITDLCQSNQIRLKPYNSALMGKSCEVCNGDPQDEYLSCRFKLLPVHTCDSILELHYLVFRTTLYQTMIEFLRQIKSS